MNTINDFYELLNQYKLITPIWKYILDEISKEMGDKQDKDNYLIIFAIYFSLIVDGNVAISLNPDTLKKKWKQKVEFAKVSLSENKDFDESKYDTILTISNEAIDNNLTLIAQELTKLMGKEGFFEIENNWLYLRKYNSARKGIVESVHRLFSTTFSGTGNFDCEKDTKLTLAERQKEVVIKGYNRNLIVTGGPGTGKTTCILFLLLSLLSNSEKDYIIYLLAPSGKASSRMKESIIHGLDSVEQSFKDKYPKVIEQIQNLEESTIHRLLEINRETGGFQYGKHHQFSENSIFVIDEASMIDIVLFNTLLHSIPDNARVFIMGDKDQLPSVESGAVFGELSKQQGFMKENVVALNKSNRFDENSDIFKLASAINDSSIAKLPVSNSDWKDYEDFEIKTVESKKYPIFYYNILKDKVMNKEIIKFIVDKWANEFYKNLQAEASNLDYEDKAQLDEVFANTENAKILCAENESVRGVRYINNLIKNNHDIIDVNKTTSVLNAYAGQLMMINTNNKTLDLYNGDSGILVTLKDDETLYFMIKKSSLLISKQEYRKDEIFMYHGYVFYPFRMISRQEIDLAYAISIHKSQGSDYRSILVILPVKQGHPLLNRQIVYTAITRTKGNTYILSSQERLEEAKETVITRDTNIFNCL